MFDLSSLLQGGYLGGLTGQPDPTNYNPMPINPMAPTANMALPAQAPQPQQMSTNPLGSIAGNILDPNTQAFLRNRAMLQMGINLLGTPTTTMPHSFLQDIGQAGKSVLPGMDQSAIQMYALQKAQKDQALEDIKTKREQQSYDQGQATSKLISDAVVKYQANPNDPTALSDLKAALIQVDPKAAAEQFLKPEEDLGKINQQDYTPDSFQKYMLTKNRGDLVPYRKPDTTTADRAATAAAVAAAVDAVHNKDNPYADIKVGADGLQYGLNKQTGQYEQIKGMPIPQKESWDVLQAKDTGQKYRISKDGSKAQAMQDNGDWQDINPNKIPADADKMGGSQTTMAGSRLQMANQRITIAANEASKDLANIVRLPLTVDRGIFGGRGQGPSLFEAGKETLTNQLTTQDVQSYNVRAAGIQRSLAAIEAAGMMPNGSLTSQMDAVTFKAGDTNFTKMQKLAQTRQILSAGLDVIENSPQMTGKQIDQIKQIKTDLAKSIPFTNEDLDRLQSAQQINPKTNLNDIIKANNQAQAPQGVDPRVWEHMTPEEQKLWQ